MKKPNIFSWATSELTQDAFICWLLSWGNFKEYEGLYNTARCFVKKLTKDKIVDFRQIEVRRQVNNIDILCVIDNETVILIEDKTNTKDHSNQLVNYLTKLSKKYNREQIIPVYLKTGDQSNFDSVEKAGYNLFLRKDFLDVLDFGIQQGISDSIFIDFYSHLTNIEKSVQSFRQLPVNQWYWDSWKGFYSELQTQLKNGNWDYVPQKNGGFLAFWWHWNVKEFDGVNYEYYLQLEHNKFCFKLYPAKRECAEKIRNQYRHILYKKAKEHNIDIYQNGRIGNCMTVAALREPYIKTDNNGFLDINKTLETIIQIQKMVDELKNCT